MELERRCIRLKGGSNLRDIGGYSAADGRRVKWGHVYRSGSLWGLTKADWSWVDQQEIRAVCDLRSDGEREIAPTVWRGRLAPLQVDEVYSADHLFARRNQASEAGVGEMETVLYSIFARVLAPSFRSFFRALTDGHVPAIVHCTAGQDRTGLAVSLLLTALGVDRDKIYADYLLSTDLRVPENEIDQSLLPTLADSNAVARFYTDLVQERGPDVFKPRRLVDAAGVPLLETALGVIVRDWGSLDAYLEVELGVGPAEVRELRGRLLEKA